MATRLENSLLLQGGTVLTMDVAMRVIPDGYVLIEGERIVAVGPGAAAPVRTPQTRVIDLSHHLVLPGLVNAHTHLPMALFRGLADDLPLKEWLERHIFPAEARFMRPETVRLGAALNTAELLLGGVTTCADGYFHEGEVLLTAAALGLGGVFAHGVIDSPAPGVVERRANLDVVRRFLAESARTGRQVPAVFAHAPYTCSAATLCAAKALSREFDTLFFTHVAEAAWEVDWCRREHGGLTPIRYLDSLGLLDARTVLVHATHVDPGEQDLIATRDAAVVVCTESNMKLAGGTAPLPGYLARRVRVGLGTDGCASNNDQDLFREMGMTARLQKLQAGDPAVVPAADVLRLATRGGAAALGLDAVVGSLEPGKRADVIAVRLDRPNAVPLYNPFSHLVYSASGADVDWVVAGGQVRVQAGQLLGADLPRLLADVQALAASIHGKR